MPAPPFIHKPFYLHHHALDLRFGEGLRHVVKETGQILLAVLHHQEDALQTPPNHNLGIETSPSSLSRFNCSVFNENQQYKNGDINF